MLISDKKIFQRISIYNISSTGHLLLMVLTIINLHFKTSRDHDHQQKFARDLLLQ